MGVSNDVAPWIVAALSIALLVGAPATVQAASLTIVTVSAPAVNCVFDATCKVTVTDSGGVIPLGIDSGTANLQSRPFPGGAGTPSAGKTIYLYRVDLRQAVGFVDCLVGMVINFGPVAKLPYNGGAPSDVFVITGGGLGTIGLKSAEQDGDVITFAFSKYVCVGAAPGTGASTFFFGLAAANAAKPTTATLFGFGSPGFVQTPARVPIH